MRTIAQISDLHFGRHDSQIAEDLLASLERDDPHLVAVSGDLTQRARPSQFQQARTFLDRIPGAKLIVPGNHDLPLYNLWRRIGKPLGHYHRLIAPAGAADNLYQDEEIAVLGIDTTRRWIGKHGRVSLGHIQAVQRAFGELSPSVFKVLMTHHPLVAPEGSSPSEVARRAPAALKASSQSQVRLLLSGHRHRAFSGHADVEVARGGAILVVHAGTAISTRTRGGEGNSYNRLRIEAGRVTVDVMAWSSDRGFHPTHGATYYLENGRWHADPGPR